MLTPQEDSNGFQPLPGTEPAWGEGLLSLRKNRAGDRFKNLSRHPARGRVPGGPQDARAAGAGQHRARAGALPDGRVCTAALRTWAGTFLPRRDTEVRLPSPDRPLLLPDTILALCTVAPPADRKGLSGGRPGERPCAWKSRTSPLLGSGPLCGRHRPRGDSGQA